MRTLQSEDSSMARTKSDDQLRREAAQRDEEREARRRLRIRCFGILKEYEPVFFRILDRDLRNDRLFHAYIFYGPAGSLKREAAFLSAQSIVMPGEHGLVQEENCSDPQLMMRVAEQEYADLSFLDGTQKKQISIDQVNMMQSFLARTAAEDAGKKILIADHAENMSEDAMNSLLKFLEEPSPNTCVIITADNIDRLISTMRSRCVLIPFHPLPEEVYRSAALAEGIDPEDAFFLARRARVLTGYPDLAVSEVYQRAKSMFRQFTGMYGDRRLFLVDYHQRYRFREKTKDVTAKDMNLDLLLYFFGMLGDWYRDILKGAENGPAWYSESVGTMRSESEEKLINKFGIVREAENLCNRTNDLSLVLEGAVCRLEKQI